VGSGAGALPVGTAATRWGGELYVSVPVDADPDRTRTDVPVGSVAYRPQGPALCLFWGPTPAGRGEEPRAAGPVAVVARLDDVTPLRELDGAATVRVSTA
jgi:hypothetical protein